MQINLNIARSSNGRTAVSGTAYRGSSPCRAAYSLTFNLIELYLINQI